MSTAIGFCLFCLIAAAAMLFYMVRYRVHVHIEYTPRPAHAGRPRRPARRPAPIASGPAPELIEDLTSALVNLGAKPARARAIAEREARAGGSFEECLRRAVQPERTAA